MNLALGIFKLTSLGAAYKAANQLFGNAELELVELTPLGDQAQIIVKGAPTAVSHFQRSLRQADISRLVIVEDNNNRLINAYLSLESSNPDQFILIAESNFVGELFEIAKEAFELGAQICDFRQLRGTASPSYLILTGKYGDKIQALSERLKTENKKVTFLSELNEKMIQFLSVAP